MSILFALWLGGVWTGRVPPPNLGRAAAFAVEKSIAPSTAPPITTSIAPTQGEWDTPDNGCERLLRNVLFTRADNIAPILAMSFERRSAITIDCGFSAHTKTTPSAAQGGLFMNLRDSQAMLLPLVYQKELHTTHSKDPLISSVCPEYGPFQYTVCPMIQRPPSVSRSREPKSRVFLLHHLT
ncbi:hypothetical protein P171DRAFT_485234 [Karstenula rhodostoma CBS 690.94]|uniref:Uncharacterized protein n=1 Tax=Karstenula rhodostoma CBS 690.94 TaxID=1392251 RepID=A0A9P4PKW8_9PLEO|nr:hypothetical protein P171DRAFT_485234 [Karstenula rhodostoma CBS 690.94]